MPPAREAPVSLRPSIAFLDHRSERAARWRALFGDTSVIIKSPVAHLAELPGLGLREVYLVDLEKLSADQLERIAEEMSRRFSVPCSVADLVSKGLPILADDVSVSCDMRAFL